MSTMSQQTQRRDIDVFIPLAWIVRIKSIGKDAKAIIANHKPVNMAILRGYVYSEKPDHKGSHKSKLVFTGNPCHRVTGVVFKQMNISDVAKIVYESQQQPSQQQTQQQTQAQQQDVQMILVALEELPNYNLVGAFLPLEYIYITRTQATQSEIDKDTRILEAIKTQKRENYGEDKKEELKNLSQDFKNNGLNNISDAIEELTKHGFKSLIEHYIRDKSKEGQGGSG